MSYQELLLGCGKDHGKRVWMPDNGISQEWTSLTTVDMNRENKPTLIWNLNIRPWPFNANTYDEVHAYEVMEHLGQQGDYETFFAHFYEVWRILKPDGKFVMTSPCWDSQWAWGDPGHTRIVGPEALSFLDQDSYDEESTRTDYRFVWKGNFKPLHMQVDDGTFLAVLVAVK